MEPTTFPQTKFVLSSVVTQLIAMKTAKLAEETLTEHTELDPDGIAIPVASGVIGQVVAYQACRLTDPAVDYVVDKTANVVKKFKNRKNKTTTDKE